jgi:hypothetical protein
MDTNQAIVVEQRITEMRRLADGLRLSRTAVGQGPGRIRQVLGGWLISAGYRVRGPARVVPRQALSRS